MAVPTDPTASNIATEAFNAIGLASPSATQVTRATTYWLQEILNDIYLKSFRDGNTRLKTLETTTIDISVQGKSFLTLAEDVDEVLDISFLDGTHTGTAQAGGASSITLASDEDASTTDVRGKYILITGGTGENGYRQCISYSTTTKVATVDSAWDTNPDNTSTYRIINKIHNPAKQNITEVDASQISSEGIPTTWTRHDRTIFFNKPFSASTYGIRMRHYLNIHEIDITGTRFTRILQNWRDVLTQGLKWKAAMDADDERQATEKKDYEEKVTNLLLKEISYGGEFGGFQV